MSLQGPQKTSGTDVERPRTPDEQGVSQDLRSGLLSLMAVMSVTAMLLSILFPEVPWSLRLLGMAVVFLSLRHWGGILILVLVQCDLLMREGWRIDRLSDSTSLVYSFCVAGVLMFVARQREQLNDTTRESVFAMVRRISSGAAGESGTQEREDGIDNTMRLAASALRGMLLLLISATMAQYVFALIPRGRDLSRQLREVLSANPDLTGGGLLITGLVAAILVLTEIGWRQMTAAQGRMYLRSGFLRLQYRDLRMVVLGRIRRRQKRSAEQAKKSAAAPDSVAS